MLTTKFKLPSIIAIILIFFSCNTNEKKDRENHEVKVDIKKTETNRKNTDSLTVNNKINNEIENSLYKAFVNNKKTVFIYEKNNFESNKLLKLNHGDQLDIIEFTDKFEKLPSNKTYDYYGKWVKVVFQKNAQTQITGYVFDDFLDYQVTPETINSGIKKDTVYVSDVKGFVTALSSNRVIWIDAEKLNLEEFVQENENELSTFDFYSDEDLEIEDETYFISEPFRTLGLSGYHNMEIRGKNTLVHIVVNDSDMHVLDFYNCSNILIDNINFYHDIPGEFVGACEGEVVTYTKCNNFNIQNSHFDGSGTIGSFISESNNFNFLNCEFYNNSDYGIYIYNSFEIDVNRCDFHDNKAYTLFETDFKRSEENTRLTLTECYIKDNQTHMSIFDVEHNYGEAAVGELYFKVDRCEITDNETGKNIFNFSRSTRANISISNSNIQRNTSTKNKLMINSSKHRNFNLTLKNTSIINNKEFYGFINETENAIKEEKLIQKNIFNTASDTILNQYNTFKNKEGEVMFLRDFKNLKFDKTTKQLSVNGHLLTGKHRINFEEANDALFHYSIDLSGKFVAEGNFYEGKLNGPWKIKLGKNVYRNEYLFNYSNGNLDGHAKLYTYVAVNENKKHYLSREYVLVSEGNFKDGIKNGIWKYYFKNGKLQRQITYEDGQPVGPFLYYFPDGTLREKRTDISNNNGETIYYYPNGEIESNITYVDGKINIKKSSFYDNEGKKIKPVEIDSYWIKDKNGVIESFVDLTSKKYKNKVHIHYSKQTKKLLGYVYYKNGKPYNLVKSILQKQNTNYANLTLKTNKGDLETIYFDHNNSIKKDYTIITNDQGAIKYVLFIDDNNLKSIFKYGGKYDLVTKSEQYKILDDKAIKHGVSKKYTEYGLLNEYKEFIDGEIKK
ncbi:right-handed parallel beta-helix repeat-containing protein [Tenacibaculum jejuense]|uniref:Probable lipoprotein n=1 Tax=Tenacibaculum jejuense TaxID=584609 RepID=A0A238UCX8_9FLAO|nr:right-handed parallel beta-helix repeat-containing protein [Tenacibaculum jejuense]SNR16942.1 Probable lipoprotein precursor [Tenacibaculum jejuense]